MDAVHTSLNDVVLLKPKVFQDERGFFLESYSRKYLDCLNIAAEFVQDNHSFSLKNVLRGLHYQVERPQGKLVRVVCGEVLDVVVDLRSGSSTFGKWESYRLSGENLHTLWVPQGFAHGFYVLSESAHFVYKTTEYYFPKLERVIAWNDPHLGIDWELQGAPLISPKDRAGIPFETAPVFNDLAFTATAPGDARGIHFP